MFVSQMRSICSSGVRRGRSLAAGRCFSDTRSTVTMKTNYRWMIRQIQAFEKMHNIAPEDMLSTKLNHQDPLTCLYPHHGKTGTEVAFLLQNNLTVTALESLAHQWPLIDADVIPDSVEESQNFVMKEWLMPPLKLYTMPPAHFKQNRGETFDMVFDRLPMLVPDSVTPSNEKLTLTTNLGHQLRPGGVMYIEVPLARNNKESRRNLYTPEKEQQAVDSVLKLYQEPYFSLVGQKLSTKKFKPERVPGELTRLNSNPSPQLPVGVDMVFIKRQTTLQLPLDSM